MDSPTATEAQFKITADDVNKHLPKDADYSTDKLDLIIGLYSNDAPNKLIETNQHLFAIGKLAKPTTPAKATPKPAAGAKSSGAKPGTRQN